MSLLQNCYLQLLQFDIRQKCRYRVSLALKPLNSSEKLWKYILIRVVKIYFVNIISFTKVMQTLQNSELQLLQFDIRHKCRQRVS